MNLSSRVIIPSSYLYSNKVSDVTILFEENYETLVEGRVFNPQNIPVPNAGIEVIKINKSNGIRTSIGTTSTNENGEYAFTINVDPGSYYEFKLYSII